MNNIINLDSKILNVHDQSKNKNTSAFKKFLYIISKRNIKNSRNLSDPVYYSLEKMGMGVKMVLDSYFINSYGKTYAEVLIDNPILAYNESSKILSDYSVKMIFKSILKHLGLNRSEIEKIIYELSNGSDKSFKTIISSAITYKYYLNQSS